MITLGCITMLMFIARFFLFHLYESPKYLISQGRQSEAVASVHGIAFRNKRKTWLSEEILNEIGGIPETAEEAKLSESEIVRRQLAEFSTARIKPLFGTKRVGLMSKLFSLIQPLRRAPS